MADEGGEAPSFTTEIDENIARNLKLEREARGWSQTELAERVTAVGVPGFYQTTVARVERAQRPLRASEAIAICGCLGIGIELLADSRRSTELRIARVSLHAAVKKFQEAAYELIHTRGRVSEDLDRNYPYLSDEADNYDQVIKAGADLMVYGLTEDALAESAPHEILDTIYSNEVHKYTSGRYNRPQDGEHKERFGLMFEDMKERLDMVDDDDSDSAGRTHPDAV